MPFLPAIPAAIIAIASLGCGGFGSAPVSEDSGPGGESCSDGSLNGDETDVDCGGSCMPCSVGKTCTDRVDCDTGACTAGVCLAPTSCKMLLDSGETLSGIYALEANGVSFDAYCDMTSAGGGWTLIMKASSAGVALSYDATLWSDESTLAADVLEPNTTPVGIDAKFASYSLVSGTELRLEFLEPAHDILYSFVGQSALALFSSPEIAVIEFTDCQDEGLLADPSFSAATMRHGQGHQFFGINGSDTDDGDTETLRFGFASNDEDDRPWQPRNGIGGTAASLTWIGQDDCNSCDGCYGTAVDPVETSANLWIR